MREEGRARSYIRGLGLLVVRCTVIGSEVNISLVVSVKSIVRLTSLSMRSETMELNWNQIRKWKYNVLRTGRRIF